MSLMTTLQTRRWEIAAFCLPILIRLIYLLELHAHPGFDSLMVDEKWHWLWAHEILEKSFWGTGAYFRGPLYPYFLSFLVWITDSSVFWAKVLQLLLSGGVGLLVFKLTKQLFNNTTAKLAAVIYALYGTFLFYDTMFLVETLFLLFALWGLYRLCITGKSGSYKSYIFTGILFGLSALARPNILLVLPFLALWLLWNTNSKGKRKFTFASPLALALGTILAIAPVTIRNYVVTGDFILISSQGGVNLYIGNNPSANGLTMLMPEISLTEAVPWDKFVPTTHAEAEKEEGRKLTEAEASAHWNHKAWQYIQNNTGQFLNLTLKKLRYLFSGFENSDNGDIYYQRTQSYLYAILLWSFGIFFPFGLLLPLALVGIWLTRDRCKQLAPIYITILTYIPSIVLFLVTARHRLLLVLLFMPFAAYAIIWLLQRIKGATKEAVIVPALIFGISIVACNIPYHQSSNFDQFQIHYNEALKLQNAQQLPAAEKEYLEAVRWYDGSETLFNNLGYIEFLQGKPVEAQQHLRQSIALSPDFYQPYNNLGLIAEQYKAFDSARMLFSRSLALVDTTIETAEQIAQLRLNLARSLLALNNTDSSRYYYYAALHTATESEKIIAGAALGFVGLKQFAVSDSLYAALERSNALHATEAANWGLSYLERKAYENGITRLRQSYLLDSSQYRIAFNLSVALHETHAPADSVQRYLIRALQIKPDYDAALKFQTFLQSQPH